MVQEWVKVFRGLIRSGRSVKLPPTGDRDGDRQVRGVDGARSATLNIPSEYNIGEKARNIIEVEVKNEAQH